MFWGKNALENLKTIENWKTAGNLSKMLNFVFERGSFYQICRHLGVYD